jgi:hypothetical protein
MMFVSGALFVLVETSAQAANPLSAGAKAQFTLTSSFVTRSADKIVPPSSETP